MTSEEQFEARYWHLAGIQKIAAWQAWQAACAWQREKDAEKSGEYAKKWWAKHCSTNKHMETTRAAHEDFCALQSKIRNQE